jgi:hypothetical protein
MLAGDVFMLILFDPVDPGDANAEYRLCSRRRCEEESDEDWRSTRLCSEDRCIRREDLGTGVIG